MSRRLDRVNELLRAELSTLLIRQIKDPRLQGVISITRVETSPDMRTAKVFLSVMGDPDTRQSALEGIQSAATFLRRELRPRLVLHHTPFLKFTLDQSMEDANQLLQIMNDIRKDTFTEGRPKDLSGKTGVSRERTGEDDQYIGPLAFPPGAG